jgi:hypothetical protein
MPFVYVVQEREFRRSQESVWKVGYVTKQTMEQRMRKYPTLSVCVLCCSVYDGRAPFTDLLRALQDLGAQDWNSPLLRDCIYATRARDGQEGASLAPYQRALGSPALRVRRDLGENYFECQLPVIASVFFSACAPWLEVESIPAE